MGVLEELERQARQRKAERSSIESAAEREMRLRRQRVQVAMSRVHDYFADFCRHLEEVQPRITVDYRLRDDLVFAGLRQHGYRFAAADPGSLDRLTFHFACEGPARRPIKVHGHDLAVAQRERLRELNLRFMSRDIADGGIAFVVEGFVPVALDFIADHGAGLVRLKLRNLFDLGSVCYAFEADRVGRELNEELAKAVLREPHRLVELTGHEVSEAARMRLRVQLAEERQRREQEASGQEAIRPRKGLLPAALGKGLFGRR